MLGNELLNEPREVIDGLKGVLVAKTALSSVNGTEGKLTVCGYDIEEFASNATFEEAVYLLWNQKRASASELQLFKHELALNRELSILTLDLIKQLVNQNLQVLEVLQIAVASMLPLIKDHDSNNLNIMLIAKFPTIIAYFWRLKHSNKIIRPKPELGHVENFFYMINGELPSEKYIKPLEMYLITVMDHGMNASTFTSRCIISSGSDIISAVLGALGSLKGPLHGGAPGPVLEMVLSIQKTNGLEAYLREILESGERIMGFGHRIYKTRDPRADVLKKAGSDFYKDNKTEIFDLFNSVEIKALELLKEYKFGREIHTNVEFYTAFLLYGLGFESELFTPLFAMARLAGWIAHAEEQKLEKSIIRPDSLYIGEYNKKWEL